MPQPPPEQAQTRAKPGPLARVVAIVISAGLAWAIALAVSAWLIGLLLARG